MPADTSETITCEEGIVAFLDVLGFRRVVEKLPNDAGLRSTFGNVLRRLAQASRRTLDGSIHGGAKYAHFSDSIVISRYHSPTTGLAEFVVVERAGALAAELLKNGIPCRGGVARGWLHHEAGVLVGEAMVRAVELEAMAKYPRIIVQDSVGEAIRAGISNIEVGDPFFERDRDGCWIINVFADHWICPGRLQGVTSQDYARLCQEEYARCRNAVAMSLATEIRERGGETDAVAKLRWLATQLNGVLVEKFHGAISAIDLA
jgi:hypothetical protein